MRKNVCRTCGAELDAAGFCPKCVAEQCGYDLCGRLARLLDWTDVEPPRRDFPNRWTGTPRGGGAREYVTDYLSGDGMLALLDAMRGGDDDEAYQRFRRFVDALDETIQARRGRGNGCGLTPFGLLKALEPIDVALAALAALKGNEE